MGLARRPMAEFWPGTTQRTTQTKRHRRRLRSDSNQVKQKQRDKDRERTLNEKEEKCWEPCILNRFFSSSSLLVPHYLQTVFRCINTLDTC